MADWQDPIETDVPLTDDAAPQTQTAEPTPVLPFDPEAYKAQLRQEILADLQPTLEEQSRRSRQAMRDIGNSIVERVQERLSQANVGLDAAVKAGRIDPDDAKQQLRDLRDQFEQEEYARERQTRAYQDAQTQVQQGTPTANPTKEQVEAQFARMFQQSGLAANDPELRLLPESLSGSPTEALSAYQAAVQAAVRAKQQRLGQTQPVSAPTNPKKTPPSMDLGGGNPVPPGNPLADINDPDELWRLAKQKGKVR